MRDCNGFLHFLDQSEKGLKSHMIGRGFLIKKCKGFRFTYSRRDRKVVCDYIGWEKIQNLSVFESLKEQLKLAVHFSRKKSIHSGRINSTVNLAIGTRCCPNFFPTIWVHAIFHASSCLLMRAEEAD